MQRCLRLVWNNRVFSLGSANPCPSPHPCSHLARELNTDVASGQCCHRHRPDNHDVIAKLISKRVVSDDLQVQKEELTKGVHCASLATYKGHDLGGQEAGP